MDQMLDQADVLYIMGQNAYIFIQKLRSELCISEDQAEATMKSFNREEQAWEKIPMHDQLSYKNYKAYNDINHNKSWLADPTNRTNHT